MLAPCYKQLHLFPSNRLKNSWYVKIHPLSEKRELHFPACLEKAPVEIMSALLQWGTLPRKGPKKLSTEYNLAKRQLEKSIRSYLDTHTRRKATTSRHVFSNVATLGTRFDLQEVFDTVNREYFNGELEAKVRWGSLSSRTSYQRTRKDVDNVVWHSITIAGIYNHPSVPRFAIEAIMYHEMLHIHIPPRLQNVRRVVHGSDFRTMEKAFPTYDKWRQWEREKVGGILRSLRRRK